MASERTAADNSDAQVAAQIAADMEAALHIAAQADAEEAAAASASASAQRAGESKEDEEQNEEEEDDAPPPKRVWTAAELLARAEAQRAEDLVHAKEEAELREEQKQMAKIIQARRVGFSNQPSGGGSGDDSSSSSGSRSLTSAADPSDYTFHDDRRKLCLVFVESGCGMLAPLAVACVRLLHPSHLSASMSSTSDQPLLPLNSLLARVLEERVAANAAPIVRASSIENALKAAGGATQVDFLVSLDEASRELADKATATLAPPNKMKRIHHVLKLPTTWSEADALGVAMKEFISELPELLTLL